MAPRAGPTSQARSHLSARRTMLVVLASFISVLLSSGMSPRSLAQAQTSDDYNDNRLLCMAEMVSSIENICSQDTQRLYVALEARLREYLTKCFHTSFTTNKTLHEMMPDINGVTTDWLKAQGDAFKLISDVEDILPTFVPSQQVNVEVEFMLHNNLASSYDGWLLDPYAFGSVSQYGAFQPLDSWVTNPALSLNWDDVLPFVRKRHVSFKGQVVAMPLDARMHLLFFRRDLLVALATANSTLASNGTGTASPPSTNTTGTQGGNGLDPTAPGPDSSAVVEPSPPLSWTELLEVAARLNGTDLNGDGTPDFGICMDVRASCGHQFNDIMGIASSMLQYQGTSQGVFFDPLTMAGGSVNAMLSWNPAFQAALGLYVNLTTLAPRFSPTATCDNDQAMVDMFRQGRCAFIMGSRVFKNLLGNDTRVRGKVGVAQLPGSPVVYDRTNNRTVACTSQICPYAAQAKDGSLVNQAPWNAGGGWVLAVNRRSSSSYLNVTVAFHAYITSAIKSWLYVTNSSFEFEPYRTSHLTNLQKWVDAGFDANDTQRWLGALSGAMDMSLPGGLGNNVAMDLRIPGTQLIRDLYVYAVTNATLGVNRRNVTWNLAAQTLRVLQDSQKISASLAEVTSAYQATIDYNYPSPPPSPPMPNTPPAPSPRATSAGPPSWLPIAIILPVIGALLLVAAAVMYEVRNKRQHKDLFGNVLPPKVAADTSILALEVQDIEAISAAVAPDALASALASYVSVVRRALQKHSGYEALYDASTGALTAAFHSPKDALLAALEVQAALLHVSWPAELLAVASCAPVYVHVVAGEAQEGEYKDILDPSEAPPPPTFNSRRKRSAWQGLASRLASPFSSRSSHSSGSSFNESPDGNEYRVGSAPAGPTIPALVHVPTNHTYSFASACQVAWQATDEKDAAKTLIFKGLRVRMAVHAGVTAPECIVENKDDSKSRVQYMGQPVELATAIAQTSQGGMILLSEDTYKKLPLERLWDAYLVIHVGEHQGLDQASGTNTNLYHALNRTLEGRLAHLTREQSPAQLDMGVLDAPVGCVTVAFMNVVGAQTLLSWNADIAQSALKRFHAVVADELKAQGGYLVEAVDGLFLAAFLRPYSAISWALECNDLMIKQAWPDELLTHELCEELVISSPTREGDMLNMVVFRGPRLKTGVDTGQVLGEVHAMTGRMTYRGKVMNRAARIASTASTGQVLCSSDSWELAQARDPALLASGKIVSSSLGQFRLKGVADRIEIQHCRKAATQGGSNRRASTLMVHCGEGWNWAGGALGGGAIDGAATAAPAALLHLNQTLRVVEGEDVSEPSDEEDEEDDDGSTYMGAEVDKKAQPANGASSAVASPEEVVLMSNNPVAGVAAEEVEAHVEDDAHNMAMPQEVIVRTNAAHGITPTASPAKP